MKKLYQFILVCMTTALVYGQGSSLVIQYENKKKDSQVYQSFVVIRGKDYYQIDSYREMYRDFRALTEDEDFLAQKYVVSHYKNLDIENTIYFSHRMKKVTDVYKDTLPDFHWKISSEQEDVLGYPCQIAYGKFRGRDYKVWFTPKLPVSAGPWKFYGLPGLVLKAASEHDLFTYEAVAINENSPLKVPQKYIDAYEDKETKSLPYKTYVERQNKMMLDMKRRYLATLPKNLTPDSDDTIRDFLEEKTFQWQKDKK